MPLTVRTADGRALEVETYGEVAAPLVLLQHGTPDGPGVPAALRVAADRLGLRLGSWARPGYAGSTRRPGRTVADAAGDAAAVATELGRSRFAVVGTSGGGPHALAVAALTGGCVAAATLASLAPWDAEGLDPMAGMGEDNVTEFGAALRGEDALLPLLRAGRAEVLTGGVDGLLAAFASLLSPPDRAVLTGRLANELYDDICRGLAPGVDGWLDDDLAFAQPWGFDPREIVVPVHLWQGGQDLMVPPAHGAWLAERMPAAQSHLLPDDGHLTLQVAHALEVLAPLADALT